MPRETALGSLARVYGVQPSYTDGNGRHRRAPRETLLAVLRQLGAPLETSADAPAAMARRERELWESLADPIVVAWDGAPPALRVRLPESSAGRAICRVLLESGESREHVVDLERARRTGRARVGRETYVALELLLPGEWPFGYHRIRVESGRRSAECVVVCAPGRSYGEDDTTRDWGVFVPLYALHGAHGRGAGHYGDLASLVDWTAGLGGSVVGTLPLLAPKHGEPFDPSPYLPDSRLLWNEFYIDLRAVPEMEVSPEARALLGSTRVRRRFEALRAAATVNYRRQAELQREVLQALVRSLVERDGERHARFRRFLRSRPEVREYARYRSLTESLERRESPAAAADYHAYTQWLATEQLEELSRRAAGRGVKLYLDLPLGVHRDGFDVWREPALFARGAEVGAPPDSFFEEGQGWSFPPLHPLRSRRLGHRYFAACLRHQMRVAGMLRVDHVMGLHRLFWIPRGFTADQGVYVQYPAEELYAVVCLESRRGRCAVVGEDLGTVPRPVRPAMRRHGLRRTFVLPYAAAADDPRPFSGLAVQGVAALNTHDLPTFAAFWRGLPTRQRKAWVGDLRRGGWLRRKDEGPSSVFRACLAYLAESSAETVLVNLEDLWSETRGQNVPGTTTERANWRGRARYPLEVFTRMPRITRALRELDRRRGSHR